MATYAIGDIQGCFKPLMALLEKIKFSSTDVLWFTGDLVNRGSQSLETLRFVKSLGKRQISVLGNHDIHLLAAAFGYEARFDDTFETIWSAPDREELIDWLRHRPLFHFDQQLQFALCHAGMAPHWTLTDAMQLAREVECFLQQQSGPHFLDFIYGNQPDLWQPELSGEARLRCIINYFTRMRVCDLAGRLTFDFKGRMRDCPPHYVPWFKVPNRKNRALKIIFGHWAALEGKTNAPNVYALDTGCVWKNCLTAMRLEDTQIFKTDCA